MKPQARVAAKDLPNDTKKEKRCEPQSLRQGILLLSVDGKLGPVTLIIMFAFWAGKAKILNSKERSAETLEENRISTGENRKWT